MSDELVQKIITIIKTHVNPKNGLANLGRRQNLSPAISEIIKRRMGEAPQVISQAPTNDVTRAIIKVITDKVPISPNVASPAVEKLTTEGNQTNEIVQRILKALKNAVPPPGAEPVTATRPEDAIGEAYWAGNRRGWVFGTPNAPKFRLKGKSNLLDAHRGWRLKRRDETNKYNFYYTRPVRAPGQPWSWPGFFRPKNMGPNFIEPVQIGSNLLRRPIYNQNPPMPGYVLTTRNGKTGWYRNTPIGPPPPGPRPLNPAPPRNYTKMTLRDLIAALRAYPQNRQVISELIRAALEKELRDLRYEYSKSRRARKLGDILRLLPRNYNGRRNASSMVVDNVRETRNNRELKNLKTNLGSVPNENIRRAFENQRRRIQRNVGGRNEEGRRPREPPRRYSGESNNNYEIRRRRAALSGGAPPRRNYSRGPQGSRNNEELARRRAALAGVPPPSYERNGEELGAAAPPPLPNNQRTAINNAGGVNRAMNTVVKVPGGAPEIAKAAEALNETRGNANMAITIKGASPEAVKAVQNLGGSKNAVNVLEGLNTLASKKSKRKTTTRRRGKKPTRPRVAELERVIQAVKKQRLISLVAHNVTKTHNIHPNDEKLKKYYQKILKANILRTPFAKIVRTAAKKNVSPRR